jgi:hypothetical protein
MSILSSWVLPLTTGILVAVFTLHLTMQWRVRRKMHQLWWAIGFAMYAAAAYMEAVALVAGSWNPVLYKVYVVTSAALVPVLALGTMALVSRGRRWFRIYLGYNAACLAVFTIGVIVTPLIPAELSKASISSYAALGGSAFTFPRVVSMLMTIPAALVLFGGAVLSIIRFVRKKEYAYRVWANVLIALATLVIASAGGMAKAGNTTLFYAAEMTAAVLYFAGFILASTLQKGAERIRAGGRSGG